MSLTDISVDNILDAELKKEFKITVPYSKIENEVVARATEIQKTFKQEGFRKGKVPVTLIRQKFDDSIMAEVCDKLINEYITSAIKEKEYKLALSPSINVESFKKSEDLIFTAVFEIFPEVPDVNFSKISVDEYEITFDEKEVKESLDRIAKDQIEWKKQDEKYKAKKGDAVKIDFLGKVDGVAFEGGESKDYQLELGSKSFIDTFEDQIVGLKAGDEKLIKVKFPKEYHKADLAGQPATFDVKVNEVLKGEVPELTNELVKEKFKLDNIEKLKEAIKEQMEGTYKKLSADALKRDVFDEMAKAVKFNVPEGLVEEQFQNMWKSVEDELKHNPNKFKNDKEKEKAKENNRKEAEKMVKMGVLLSEVARKNEVKVEQADILEEIKKRASQFPGQEKFFIEYYQKNQEAVNSITGEILEGKVIDFMKDKINLKKASVSFKDFQKKEEKKAKKAK